MQTQRNTVHQVTHAAMWLSLGIGCVATQSVDAALLRVTFSGTVVASDPFAPPPIAAIPVGASFVLAYTVDTSVGTPAPSPFEGTTYVATNYSATFGPLALELSPTIVGVHDETEPLKSDLLYSFGVDPTTGFGAMTRLSDTTRTVFDDESFPTSIDLDDFTGEIAGVFFVVGLTLVNTVVAEVSTVTVVELPSPADLNFNGTVDATDVALLLGAWGTQGGAADLDTNGTVGAGDLAIVLGAWSV